MTTTHVFWLQRATRGNTARFQLIPLSGTLLFGLISALSPLFAQPSGGPYGPIQQTYELPEVAGKIYYVAPEGNADASGETLEQPTTIESAVAKVVTGDAIVMRGGVYRTGNLELNQQITIQPWRDEQPILKGTYLATEWQQQENGLWVTTWERLFPDKPQDWWRRHRHGADVPRHRFNNDMLFVDGRFLQSAGWEGELDENSYYIDYDAKKVYLSIDPTGRAVEITAFNGALSRLNRRVHGKASDGKGPTIRGITFTQYAYRAIEISGKFPNGISAETEHGKDVVGTTFENCTITYCSRVAGYFYGDGLTIRNCKVSDTSTEGIYIIASNDVLLERNVIARNNIEKLHGYYPAAVKIFNQCYRVTCRDNLVIDQPNSTGIWYDVGNVDGVFINNWIQAVSLDETVRPPDSVWPNGAGFFFEISKGAICAGNVFVNCDSGVHVLNSSNVRMYQNTFINSQALISRTARVAAGDHFDWHPGTGPDIDKRHGHVFKNNLLVGDEDYNKPLLKLWQPANLCGRVDTQQVQELDNNVYVRASGGEGNPLLFWSPYENEECRSPIDSLADLRKLHPEFSKNSLELNDYREPLFKNLEPGKLQLLPGFQGAAAAAELPPEISRILGRQPGTAGQIGAYPTER